MLDRPQSVSHGMMTAQSGSGAPLIEAPAPSLGSAVDVRIPRHRTACSESLWSLDRICVARLLGIGLAASLGAFALGGCPATHPPSDGCGKDTDCKGDRICIQGE